MIVGQDIAILRDNDAGAEAVLELRTGLPIGKAATELIAEKAPPELVIEAGHILHRRLVYFRGGYDFDHGRRDFFHDRRVTAMRQCVARNRTFVHGHVD